MDLALLVYGISLLGGLSAFFGIVTFCMLGACIMSGIFTATWRFDSYEYSWNLNRDGTVRDKVQASRTTALKIFKWSLVGSIISSMGMIFLPSERTAYMMVGAYATQKIAENGKVQDTGKKVLTIIEQKLDTYIDEGVKQAEKKVSK